MNKTQQFCTFFLEDHFLGVPVQQVQEVIRYQEMTQVPLAPRLIRGLINLRGHIVLAVDLRQRFGMAQRPDTQLPMNFVVRTEDGPVSFLVDEIGDVIEVQEEFFEHPPETLQGSARDLVRGVYKLPGRLLLVLNTERAVAGGDPSPTKPLAETALPGMGGA